MTSSEDTKLLPIPAGVHASLAKALKLKGYESLTPVQYSVLDAQNDDKDLLVSAQTGSGKTVAFGLAIAPTLLGEEMMFGRAHKPLALVIAPTRELALQVRRELDWLYAQAGVVTTSCVGGMDIRAERVALNRGAHIVVGTPGRLRDHITKNALDLSQVEAVILDEADEMLDLGFREDLEFILEAAPTERRTLLFSATVSRDIANLAKAFQKDAVRLTVTDAREKHADIEYQVMLVHPNERENAVINTLLAFGGSNAMVFCHTRESVKRMTARLANRGFAVVALSGELTQAERSNALQAMRDGRARVCVATDVAARGIDLPNLDLVVHADVPSNPETLLHRSGRTGRAGRKGVCVLITPAHRRGAVSRVMKYANIEAVYRAAPTSDEIDAYYRDSILEAAVSAPNPAESEMDMVNQLMAKTTPEQLAVAFLRQQVASRPAPEDITEVNLDRADRGRDRDREKGPRRDKPFGEKSYGEGRSDGAPRERSRKPEMEGGVWFSLSIGRKQRADPKWILPMICKAGGVTKKDVGSIKIEDVETRFEISGDRAQEFAASMAVNGTGESGVSITKIGAGGFGGAPRGEYKAKPKRDRFDDAPRSFKPKGDFKGKPRGEFKGKPKRDFA